MKNLAIVSQFFYPSHASTAQLMTDLARGFVLRGYNVSVFTSVKNIDNSSINPDLNSINITRSFSHSSKNHSILNKIASSLFFIIQGIFYLSKIDKTTTLLIASNPPYVGIIGLFFKFIYKGKYYFLLQDIFPESAVISEIFSKNNFLFILFSKLVYQICLQSEKTIVLNEAMKLFLEQKYPALIDKQKVNIIENWAIEKITPIEKSKNPFAIQYQFDKKFTILYSGNIGRLHDIETIAEAIKLLKKYPIQFVFIGDGAKKAILEKLKQEKHLSNLLILPFQPREFLSNSLTACDVSLVSLVTGAEKIIAPCKLYGMLSAGRAIVSVSEPNSYLDNLLSDNHCGINCPPKEPEKLAQIFIDLAKEPQKVKNMGEKARQLYQKRYTFDRAIEEYEQLLFKKRSEKFE